MSRIYTSSKGTQLIYDCGIFSVGATDNSPNNLVDMFSGMHFQALAEGKWRKSAPEFFSRYFIFPRPSVDNFVYLCEMFAMKTSI